MADSFLETQPHCLPCSLFFSAAFLLSNNASFHVGSIWFTAENIPLGLSYWVLLELIYCLLMLLFNNCCTASLSLSESHLYNVDLEKSNTLPSFLVHFQPLARMSSCMSNSPFSLAILYACACCQNCCVLWGMLWDRVKGKNCGLISYKVVWFSGSLSERPISPPIREGFSSLIVC